jgi:hypothetical protein
MGNEESSGGCAEKRVTGDCYSSRASGALMGGIRHWDLIHLFNFYLALVFLLSLVLRVGQYASFYRIARAFPERWPNLLAQIRQHHAVFLTLGNLWPALTALGLCGLNMLACRLVWPHAQLTVGRLFEISLAVPFVLLCGVAMVALDIYATLWVTEVDRAAVEKYFDQAEFWLKSWTGPVVRVVTFGRLNPRQMVNVEVRKALVDASQSINSTMWWLTAQTGVRIAYGLSLWLTFAFAHG